MSSTEFEWTKVIDPPWLAMPPVPIGEIPSGLGTPDYYLLVTVHNEPMLRVDAYAGSLEYYSCADAVNWGNFFVIGWGERVYLINSHSRDVSTHLLDGYFGQFNASREYLLLASAERCYRMASDGSMMWKSERLGIDGVVVKHIIDGTIYVEGEWDPPCGWKPYQISLDSGYTA